MSGKFKDTDDDISFDDFDESLDDEIWDEEEILDDDTSAPDEAAFSPKGKGKSKKVTPEKKARPAKDDSSKKGAPVVMIAGVAVALVAGVSVFALMGSAPDPQDSVVSLEPLPTDVSALPTEPTGNTVPPQDTASQPLDVAAEQENTQGEQVALPPTGQTPPPASSGQDDVLTPLPQTDSFDQTELPPLLVDKVDVPTPSQESEGQPIEMPLTDRDAFPADESALVEDKLLKETEKPFAEKEKPLDAVEEPVQEPSLRDNPADLAISPVLPDESVQADVVERVVEEDLVPAVVSEKKPEDAVKPLETAIAPQKQESPVPVPAPAEKVVEKVEQSVKTEARAAEPVAQKEIEAPKVEVPVKDVKPVEVAPVKNTEEKQEIKAVKPARVAWALRSAQTGSAVLLEKYSQEMRAVEVGDSLRGFGRITAIEKVNGKWRVVTTGGTINQ